MKGSFKQNNLRDEKTLGEYFSANVGKSIEYVVDYLEKTDTIINFEGLKELFHRKGLNMRFGWIVYMKLQRQRAKALVGADILARNLKRLIDNKTSLKQDYFTSQVKIEATMHKDKLDEIMNEKIEFLMENYAKSLFAQYLNIFIKNAGESSPNLQVPKTTQIPQNILEVIDEESAFDDMSTELFLNKMRLFDFAKKLLNNQDFDFYLSAEIIRNILNISCLHTNLFIDVRDIPY